MGEFNVIEAVGFGCAGIGTVLLVFCRNRSDERRTYVLFLLFAALLTLEQVIDWWHGRWTLENRNAFLWLVFVAPLDCCVVIGWLGGAGRRAFGWWSRRRRERRPRAAGCEQ